MVYDCWNYYSAGERFTTGTIGE